MLVTQPPIKELTVSMECCPTYEYAYPYDPQPAIQTITNPNGLTLGDLYDRTEKLLNEHRFCTSAYNGLLEDDGSVRVGVRFVGKMELHADDPIYVAWKKQQRVREENDRKRQRRTAKLEAFCTAKRTGEHLTPFTLNNC
jgi:hypothetical protein